ncbi:MAG TPA: hypothetical protein VNV42_04785 [Solirubrobacteraceae bacterium]|jgi:hypothetical protein|nr:hypothetical protein [Solirubrobacteraceae bacterium]
MAGGVSVLALAVLAQGAIAVGGAGAEGLAGEAAVFNECPRLTTGVNFCIYAKTVGGAMRLGQRTVPIEAPFVLQAGDIQNENVEPWSETMVGALNGETLSRGRQRVPGGLLGLPLYATLELAAPAGAIGFSASNFVNQEGVAVSLPVKIHLENLLLGGECYIGTRVKPIVLNFTTGETSPDAPNTPIAGTLGDEKAYDLSDGLRVDEATGARLVDNAFSAPAATGCGGSQVSALVDQVIDYQLGLPSPDGRNMAIENLDLLRATAEDVIKAER